jgi:hypothetical protein
MIWHLTVDSSGSLFLNEDRRLNPSRCRVDLLLLLVDLEPLLGISSLANTIDFGNPATLLNAGQNNFVG